MNTHFVSRSRSGLIAAAFMALAIFGHAQIALNINTSNHTFWFTGNDTGTPTELNAGTNWAVVWGDPVDFPPEQSELIGLFSAPGTTPVVYMNINSDAEVGSRFDFGLRWSTDPGSPTISGTAVTFDYSGFDEADQSVLESYIGGTVALTSSAPGSGFSPISVSAVPEPATYPTLVAMGAFGFSVLRRRRRTLE